MPLLPFFVYRHHHGNDLFAHLQHKHTCYLIKFFFACLTSRNLILIWFQIKKKDQEFILAEMLGIVKHNLKLKTQRNG